ncbi:hypothetical protein PYCCODRAFT_1439190 [Trametes coccinea BRFM310]|uniref:Mediator of RNA polymerase II transcription subunit 25 von Willebrand factor type A domain-containing protein n=1 Tax=Trametes coccinea (strain BRFM310) TaxID=1353009 RepID=A0A1Y2IF44_TRAC3|nr:hypothetical protein PYCCODRAFT_1439190 [Trametes coccinea BRFM310]
MTEVIAVACVIESSLALAAEWPQVQMEYIVPLLQRLGESHQTPAFRIACVSYGTADTMPTPVLSKVFFSPPQTMIKDMREDPQKLGIGQTDSGGGYGMAALEGLVAAIELFDTLKSSVETAMSCHLIHFASTPPNPAERPMWNVSMALDSVTWDTLPAELKKRGINYSNVLLKPIPRLTQLHAAAAFGPVQNPWFTVRAPHVLHLSGFPQKGTKRPGSVDRSPEIAKRAKVQSSPLKSPAVISAPVSSPPQPAPPAAVKTPSMPPAVPPASAAPAASQPQADPAAASANVPLELIERFRSVHANLKAVAAQAQLLSSQGRTEEAAKVRAELTQKAQKYQQFRQFVAQRFGPALAAAAAEKAGLVANAPTGSAPSADAPRPPTATDLAAKLEPNRMAPSTTAAPPAVSSATAEASAASKPPGMQAPLNMSPEVAAAQMQKLVEQKNRSSHLAVQPAPPNQPQPPPPQLPSQSQIQPSQPPAQLQPQPTPSTSAVPDKSVAPGVVGPRGFTTSRWFGTLSWTGFDAETHVKKDVHAGVIIVGNNAELMHPEKWPNMLSLAPSQHNAVSVQMLQAWLQSHKCVALACQTNPQAQDPKKNDEHFRSLVRLLKEKNVYALASWPGSNGVLENRILFFVIGDKVAGAYFPLPGGVPELPKADTPAVSEPPRIDFGGLPIPSHIVAMLSKMGQKEQQAFAKLPQDKKMQWIKLLLQKHLAAAKQAQQQQPAPGQQGQGSQAGPSQGPSMSAQQQQPNPGLQQPPQQPAGPSSQLQNATRNLQQQFHDIRPGNFNPWMQNSGPNVTAILSTAATGHSGLPSTSPQPNPAQQNLMANLGMNFGGMGQMGQMQQPQQTQQSAPGVMPGQGMGMGMGMGAGMGMNLGMGMNMGMGMGMGGPGMHRRTPSAGAQTGMAPGLSFEMMQSFIQRNQEGSAGPNPGLGGM